VDIGTKIKTLAVELTQIRSVVGTAGENDVAKKIYETLAELDYFRLHPDNLRLLPVRDDELGRNGVFALIEGARGHSKKNVALHWAHGYGRGCRLWRTSADRDPSGGFETKLAAVTKFSEPALSEILSDDWLLGRGILDMKTGVASLMVMVEHFPAARRS